MGCPRHDDQAGGKDQDDTFAGILGNDIAHGNHVQKCIYQCREQCGDGDVDGTGDPPEDHPQGNTDCLRTSGAEHSGQTQATDNEQNRADQEVDYAFHVHKS